MPLAIRGPDQEIRPSDSCLARVVAALPLYRFKAPSLASSRQHPLDSGYPFICPLLFLGSLLSLVSLCFLTPVTQFFIFAPQTLWPGSRFSNFWRKSGRANTHHLARLAPSGAICLSRARPPSPGWRDVTQLRLARVAGAHWLARTEARMSARRPASPLLPRARLTHLRRQRGGTQGDGAVARRPVDGKSLREMRNEVGAAMRIGGIATGAQTSGAINGYGKLMGGGRAMRGEAAGCSSASRDD